MFLVLCLDVYVINMGAGGLQTVVLKVAMSCQGCVGAVNRVLGKMEGSLFSTHSILITLFDNPLDFNLKETYKANLLERIG